MGSKESIEQSITPETRAKAIKMLRSRQCDALREVEKLLGWESSIAMGDNLMAQMLGITKWQLLYMIFHDKSQKKTNERLIAEKEARNIKYTNYTSSKLRFSISYPTDWKVNTDRLETEPGLNWEGVYEAFRHTVPDSATNLEYFKHQAENPSGQIGAEEAYEKLLEGLKGSAMDFEKFKDNYLKDQEKQREAERRREELNHMQMGYFEVSPHDDADYPSIEVTKLKLIRSTTPLELYQLDKPNPEEVPWGNRPSTGITVDGLHGIKYYYILDTGETRVMTEMPRFFNVYLTENKLGWIISCSCKEGIFRKYKPVFTYIVNRFRRT